MSPYQVATGHDNEAGFVTVDPQPMSQGVQYPRYITALDGTTYPDGAGFVEWLFGDAITVTQYTTLLTAMGLTTAASSVSALVTIATRGFDFTTFSNYNATVTHVKGQDSTLDNNLWRDVRFRFTHLETT